MTAYQAALLVHLLALLAASSASALVHFAARRKAQAPGLREALEWGKVVATTARIFPIAVVALVASGAWMTAARWGWSTGWVEAGFAGAVLLLVSGAVLGTRGAADARASVARLQQAGHDLPNDARPDPVAALLGEANTGLALAIVVVMTLKPALLPSLLVLALGAAAFAWRGMARVRAAAGAAPATQGDAQAA
ncbi:MAG TPA: hypothetical protein VGD77_12030 [Gemmatimonadaceae bacterium]